MDHLKSRLNNLSVLILFLMAVFCTLFVPVFNNMEKADDFLFSGQNSRTERTDFSLSECGFEINDLLGMAARPSVVKNQTAVSKKNFSSIFFAEIPGKKTSGCILTFYNYFERKIKENLSDNKYLHTVIYKQTLI